MRLIDADNLSKKIECPGVPLVYWSDIEAEPTVDAVPVVHGKWEVNKHNGFLVCSQCKDVYIDADWLQDGKWNFCPSCGAKMDRGH